VVLGGVSLGTNVILLVTVQAPDRVRGLVLEMPVLEWAVPAAALTFVPFLLQAHYARPVMRLASRVASRLPRSGLGPLDSCIGAVSSDPDEIAAVLHGVLLGPIAPTIDQRRAITAPALVLGHGIDLIHSFKDAQRLARQLPDARLIRTRTFAELWVRPARLTAEIGGFLDSLWTAGQPRDPATPQEAALPARGRRPLAAAGRERFLAAASSSDTPCSMPRASTSRSGFAAKSPVRPNVMVPQ
jgi:hypothetical protein